MNAMIATQCAWCSDVKVGGQYVAIGVKGIVHEIDLPTKNGRISHYAVSHGICPACKEKITGHSLAA